MFAYSCLLLSTVACCAADAADAADAHASFVSSQLLGGALFSNPHLVCDYTCGL
jgi:hypothetical protein